jgi:hypothetical protein
MFKGALGTELNDEIMAALSDDLKAKLKGKEFVVGNDGTYLPASKLTEVTEKKRLVEESLNQMKADLEAAKKGAGAELATQLDALQKKYTEDLAAKDKEFNLFKTKTVAEKELEKAGAAFPDLLLSKLNFEGIDTSKEGAFKDQIETLKGTYGSMFKETKVNGTLPVDGIPGGKPDGHLEQLQNKKDKSLNDFAALLSGIPKK